MTVSWPRRLAGILVSLALLGGAVFLLSRALKDVTLVELVTALNAVPRVAVASALGLTVLSHLALSIYDYLGIRYIGRKLGYPRVALTAFCAYAISHALGFPAVTGGAVRYRLYSRWGFGAVEVAQVMGMAGVTLFIGLFEIGGVSLLLDGSRVKEWSELPQTAINILGGLCLAAVATYLVLSFVLPGSVRIGGFTLKVPTPRFALMQMLISAIDWLLVASVLYVLLPDATVSYPVFLGAFVLAYLVGTLSNVPGGLGTFDSIIIVSLRHSVSTEALVVSLLVYRAVYHLFPLIVGGAILAYLELRGRPAKR